MFECPVPNHKGDCIQMAHGGGGRMMNELIHRIFLQAFGESVDGQQDAAVLPFPGPKLALTTDSFVVQPLEFSGGTIGSLAVHGTVNDLAMSGAEPLYLTAAFILEEGLPLDVLERIVRDMAQAAQRVGIRIVTGDTKVVERGHGDGMFINTSGVGLIRHSQTIAPSMIRPGDAILLSGDLGRHGMTVMSHRVGLSFGDRLSSDSAPLHESVAHLIKAGITLHCMRDVTRGGLTATLSELAESSKLTFCLEEEKIPVRDDVRAACGLLGLDPLQVACEGRYLVILPGEESEKALEAMRSCPVSSEACLIGHVESFRSAPLLMKGVLGVERILPMPSGLHLPRIC